MDTETPAHPRIGALAILRNRRGTITAVELSGNPREERIHLVTIEYSDSDGVHEDQVVWEREIGRKLLDPSTLPEVSRAGPMPKDEFDALVRATRWTAMTPFVNPDGPAERSTLPLAAPFHGAIQIEDFQLMPLLKALQMPRVSLLLGDDVGLGKTVEAGLILSELLLRRRVRRVLVITPASLCMQWKQELRDKFSIGCDIVDREQTHAMRKRLGMDANPWRTYSRIITSYYYLKQPDVLEQFRAACRVPDGSPHLPWDLLIVDEAHNLSPAAYGEDSELSKLLSALAPFFEHKMFLTATPHNGHTRCFTGLLERLDPVRFSQTSELSRAERERVEDVVIRRLKREINARCRERGEVERFCNRFLKALTLQVNPAERALSAAFKAFRSNVRSLIAASRKSEQLAGSFAVEVLGKRLLSCPITFADSWFRYKRGLAEAENASAEEVRAAAKTMKEDTGDDRETESRTALAAHTVGAWLQPLASKMKPEMDAIDSALTALGLDAQEAVAANGNPRHDARLEAFCAWIDSNLRDGKAWKVDERLVVFTEYKTTLDYLKRRLISRYPEKGAIRTLFGGMDEYERDEIKAAFNDPNDAVRVLIATDAASEGLNLQESARFLLHYDVPWNPARLEQRNGRLDRHGQARDVTIFHFASTDDAELNFLAYVIEKTNTIREDLGSMEEIFDAAFQEVFIDGRSAPHVRAEIEAKTAQAKQRAEIPRDKSISIEDNAGEAEAARLKTLAAELDLDPETLSDTLQIALGIGVGQPRFEVKDERGRVRLKQPIPGNWESLIDDHLRLRAARGQKGPLPALVFDPMFFIETKSGRPVFRQSRDTVMLHLAHPVYHRALASFARARFPSTSGQGSASRWTVCRAPIPAGLDALILLTVEEMAGNELRELFHHWVRTIRLPVKNGALEKPLAHIPAASHRINASLATDDVERAAEIWDDVMPDVKRFLSEWTGKLDAALIGALAGAKTKALADEQERFKSRQGELSSLMEQQTMERLQRELDHLQSELQQGLLFDNDLRLRELAATQKAKEEELARRTSHYRALREQLSLERERVIEHLLPRRFTMRGHAQVFPVTIEIRLPEKGHGQ